MQRRTALQRAALGASLLLTLMAATSAVSAATIGQPAPDFEVMDAAGKTVRLSDYKGKLVVLEWTNPGCPFVQKHYNSQNMQGLQKEYTAKSVVWLSVSSTAKDSSDYLAPAALNAKLTQDWGGAPSAVLMDDAGTIGKAYGARTTPHMYVIAPTGRLLYAGGIDDKRSSDVADVKIAKNFVRAALGETMAGKPVSTPTATPYGCSIKYAS